VTPVPPVPTVADEAAPLVTSATSTPTRTGKLSSEGPAAAAMSGRARRKNPFKARTPPLTVASASAPKPPSPSVDKASAPLAALLQPPLTDTPPPPSPTGACEPRPLEAADSGEPSTATASTRRSGYNTRSVSFFSSPTTGLPVVTEHLAHSPMSAGELSPPGKGRKRVATTRGAPVGAADRPPASKRQRRLSERLRSRIENAADEEGDAGEAEPVVRLAVSVAGRPDSSECDLLSSAGKVVAKARLVKSRKVFHGIPVDPDVVVVSVHAVSDALYKYPSQSRYALPGRRRRTKRLADLLGSEVVWSCEHIAFAS